MSMIDIDQSTLPIRPFILGGRMLETKDGALREVRHNCLSCEGTELETKMTLFDQEKAASSDYLLVRCPQCTLEFIQDPVPRSEILEHYPFELEAYNSELGETIPAVKRFLFWLDGRHLIKRLNPGDLILDVGAGLGTFGQYLINKGFNVIAADHIAPIKWPRKTMTYYQVDLNDLDPYFFEELRNNKSKPKAIVMRHVLEHVYDPKQLLEVLSQTGNEYFLIVVPNGGSWFRYIFKKYWGFFEPPRHLSNFNRTSIKNLLNRVGFDVVNCSSYGMDEVAVSIYRFGHSWRKKIRNLFSWSSKAMLLSSAISLPFGRSVLVVLAKRKTDESKSN